MIRIYEYGEVESSEIFARPNADIDVSGIVRDIIENVRKNGDKALYEYGEKFDKVALSSLEVTAEEIDEAFCSVDEKFLDVMRRAKENIYKFHIHQKRSSTFRR